MNIFQKLKKKQEKQEKPQMPEKQEKPDKPAAQDEIKTSGWEAVTRECERIYPDQKDPKHYGTLIKWQYGIRKQM